MLGPVSGGEWLPTNDLDQKACTPCAVPVRGYGADGRGRPEGARGPPVNFLDGLP